MHLFGASTPQWDEVSVCFKHRQVRELHSLNMARVDLLLHAHGVGISDRSLIHHSSNPASLCL